MEETPRVWEESFTVRSYQVDALRRAQPRTIAQFIQEAAIKHALALGVGREKLPGNSTWMLSRLRIEMERWPTYGDEVHVKTWPSGRQKLHALRDFSMEGYGGAASAWVVVDMARRRPLRLPESVHAIEPPDRPRALGSDPVRLPLPDRIDDERRFTVRWSECDANAHANQSAYIAWAIDALPSSLCERTLVSLEADFRSEACLGDDIVVRWTRAGEGTVFTVLLDGDRELARLRTRWA